MELEVTTGNTDRLTDVDTAMYAVMLPTRYQHLSGTGMGTLIGPTEVETHGRREYKVIRDAVDAVVKETDSLRGSRIDGDVLVTYRLRNRHTEMTGKDIKAYRDRDLTHLVNNWDLNKAFIDRGIQQFVVEIPGSNSTSNQRLCPAGDIPAPYLVGSVTVDAGNDWHGTMKDETVLQAGYTALTGSEQAIDDLDDDEVLRVWKIECNAGGIRYHS